MIATLGILFALFLVGAFIYYCFAPQYADDRRSMVTLAGVITLVFIFMAIICILELKDTVVLTNKKNHNPSSSAIIPLLAESH